MIGDKMMSSRECLLQKQLYESIKEKVIGVNGYVDDCVSSINLANESISQIIVSGKPIDEEKLTDICNDISKLPETLQAVVSECNEKITYYENLYRLALVREQKGKNKYHEIAIN